MKKIILFAFLLLLCMGAYSAHARVVALQAEVHTGGAGSGGLVTGSHDVVVAIYSGATGGLPIWYEVHEDVSFTNGIFSIVVGSATMGGVPNAYFNGNYYYGVTVSGIGRGELEPRGQAVDNETTWIGFWKRASTGAGGEAAASVSVYPNPFTSSIAVQIDLSERASVSATVYDITGREVARPMVARELDKGMNRIEWSPGNVGPGTYILRLQVGGKEQPAIPIQYIR